MIKIRLQRHGARHAPFYRMVVAPSTARRDGKFIEVLGTYNPQAHVRTEELKLKMERIDHWLGVGAQPTDTAKSLIRQGRLTPEDWLTRSENRAAKKLAKAKKGNVAPSMEETSTEPEEKKVEEVVENSEEKSEDSKTDHNKESENKEANEKLESEQVGDVSDEKKDKAEGADSGEKTKGEADKNEVGEEEASNPETKKEEDTEEVKAESVEDSTK